MHFFRFTTYLSDAIESYIAKKLKPYPVVVEDVLVLEDRVREAQLFANKVSSHIFATTIDNSFQSFLELVLISSVFLLAS